METERAGRVLELVLFKLKEGVTSERFLATVDAVSTWARTQPGFLSRDLSHDRAEDRWIEVVYWRTLGDAEAAADAAQGSAACAPMFADRHGLDAVPPCRAGDGARPRRGRHVNVARDGELDEVTDLALAARDGDRGAGGAVPGGPATDVPLGAAVLWQPDRRRGRRAGGADPLGHQPRVVRGTLPVHHVGAHGGGASVAAHRPPRAEASVAGADAFGAFIDSHVADPVWEPASRVEYESCGADVRLSCTYGMLLCLSQDQRVAYLLGDLLGFSDAGAAEICEITRAAFRQRLARARVVMRTLMAERCGLVRAGNPCRCDRLVHASIDSGLLDPLDPRWARHGGVTLPIETTTVDAAARELDLAVAAAEVFRTDPSFAAPATVWTGSPAPFPLCSATGDRTPRGGVARVSVAGGG